VKNLAIITNLTPSVLRPYSGLDRPVFFYLFFFWSLAARKQENEFLVAGYATMARHITPETGLVYRTQTAAGPETEAGLAIGALESPFGSMVHGMSR
jgi:hypothetical protein